MGGLILKLYLTTLSKKKKTNAKFVLELVRKIEKQSNIVKFTENGKGLLLKLIRYFLPIKNFQLKTPTAPGYWLRFSGIDDEKINFSWTTDMLNWYIENIGITWNTDFVKIILSK